MYSLNFCFLNLPANVQEPNEINRGERGIAPESALALSDALGTTPVREELAKILP